MGLLTAGRGNAGHLSLCLLPRGLRKWLLMVDTLLQISRIDEIYLTNPSSLPILFQTDLELTANEMDEPAF